MNRIRIAIGVVAVALAGFLIVSYSGLSVFEPDYEQPLYDEPPSDAETAVFAGNSHTAYNSVPYMVQRIAASDERHPPLAVGGLNPGGWTLVRHGESGRTADLIADAQPDYVVLQGASTSPLMAPDEYRRGVGLVVGMADARGAEPILYQTWAHAPHVGIYDRADTPGDPESAFTQIDRVTTAVAEEYDVALAPVGRAWERVRRWHTEYDLYRNDGNHAQPAGSYLAALVIYRAIVDDSLPDDCWKLDSMSDQKAEVLQQVADGV